MKINPISNPNVIRSYQASKPTAAKPGRASAGLDEVTFSEEALSFSKMMAEARDKIELRSPAEKEHIARLTEAVRRGDYRIDSDKIAESILGTVSGADNN